ncbi:MAG: hypothetical protein JNM07_07955 [Phycisphaerae bacterium]|nr:hypothetical protein [Phycisphaerae bacterium]
MQRIVLESGRLRVEINQRLGASISDLSIKGPNRYAFPIMRRAAASDSEPGAAACFLMAPWTNRVAGASFEFAGARRTLRPTTGDGTAMHGDVRGRPWELLDRSPISARLRFRSRSFADVNYPFPFECEARYEIHPDRLLSTLSVTNAGESPMPAGCGPHPYFMRRLWDDADAVEIRMNVKGRYPLANRIPTGPARDDELCAHFRAGGPLPATPLDDVFSGFGGSAEIRWPSSGVQLRLECSRELGHVVVFTPNSSEPAGRKVGPLPWFALEPVTQVNDALNLMARGVPDTGTVVLQPGATLSAMCNYLVESR